MKKLLLATSAIAVMSGLGASAYVRDGVVEAGKTNVELFITGEVSSYLGVTSVSAELADGTEVYAPDTFFGQDYSGDIDFIAKVHSRGWDITGNLEIDLNTAGKDGDGLDLDEAYIDFSHAMYGTFRTGRAPAPSDVLSLEASLPGENWDDVSGLQNVFAPAFAGLGNSRFADDANQLAYHSPKFGNMFQFGVAYIFNDANDSLDADTLANDTDNDAIEAAAKLHGETSGFNYGMSAAYRTYLGDLAVGSTESKWTTGLLIGYMGFNWVTTYGETEYADVDTYDWGVRTAVTYAWDKWEAGVAYEYGQDKSGDDWTVKSSLIEAGLSYQSFPGLKWHGAVAFAETDLDESYGLVNGVDWSEATASGVQFRAGVDLSW